MRGPCPRPLDEGSGLADLWALGPKRAGSIRANFLDSSGTPLFELIADPTPAPGIPRSEHSISRAAISPNALKVLYRLKEAGYQGFLVGGAVRDLLLGLRPKDFDVATDALPEEVRRLFRNCRLIGRRFRSGACVFRQRDHRSGDLSRGGGSGAGRRGRSGRRSRPRSRRGRRGGRCPESGAESRADEPAAEFSPPADSEHRAFDPRGRILRDNIYGTIEEDVWRRDFAANGLYYNIEDFSIWDFVDGVERRQGASPEDDRRSGDALSRRSGAHAPGGAFRGQARFLHRAQYRAADQAAGLLAGRRSAGAIVR